MIASSLHLSEAKEAVASKEICFERNLIPSALRALSVQAPSQLKRHI